MEVGYDLEEFITDGFAGEVSREQMAPEFRRGDYGAGLLAGVSRIVDRIAERRNVTLQGLPAAAEREPRDEESGLACSVRYLHPVHRHQRASPDAPAGVAAVAGARGRGVAGTAASDRSAAASAAGASAAAAASAAGSADLAAAAAAVAAAARRGSGRDGLLVTVGDLREGAMTLMRKTAITGVLIVAAFALSGCSYNRFVGQEEAIKTQWAQVENQLQRRNDLIPNLVETVKGIAQQERDVFGQIADSRAKLAGAQTPEQTIQAANEQSAALARLLVIVENYPQLRSNEPFARLMDELVRHREPHRRRAHALQRARPGVQHVAPAVPVERHGGHLRLQGVPAVQRAARGRAGAAGQLRPSRHRRTRCRSSMRCCPSSITR